MNRLIDISRSLFLLVFFVTLATNLKAQRIDSLLYTLDEKYPQEKIYLHLDKPYYSPGETIWFKAYITTRSVPSGISKTLFAELLNDKGNIIQRKLMPVFEGGAAASFDLSDSLRASQLYIRAYTAWNLNFDSSLLYVKPVSVIQPKAPKKPAVASSYSLTLFPEGGDLIEGIATRVAFKAVDQDGKPVTVSGSVTDDKGKKLADFSSLHDGMGSFNITPQTGGKYKAIWKDKKGIAHETAFPAILDQGLSLSVSNEGGELKYTLTRPENVDKALTTFAVVAQMQQQLMYSAKINLANKTTVTAPVLTQDFPNGVLQITVFNTNQIPVAERLVFINQGNYSFITDLHAVEKNLAKRGHNTLQIDVGDTLLANLSISVTDASVNPAEKNDESILSGLLLSSDIKGYVYNPAYYFSSDDDSVKQHLDLVMMTNGWRRFKWQEVLAEQWPKINYIPENYLSVSGKVFGLSKLQMNGKDLTGFLKVKGSALQPLYIPVSSTGQFNINGLYFFDTAKLYYQFNGDKDKVLTSSASFSFDNNFVKAGVARPDFLASLYPSARPDSSLLQKFSKWNQLDKEQTERNKIKTLQSVTVKVKQKSLKEKMDEEYTSGLFSGGDAYTFTTEDDPFARSSPSVLSYLQGKVAGLQITTSGQGSASWRGSTPSFFLNESTTDMSQLQSISMNDVAMIKVFRPPFFGSMGGGAGGAIAIYTKKGGGDNSAANGLPFSNIYGYSAIKEFYSPDYATNNDPMITDYRTTLYWNPFVLLDRTTRRVRLPFFNSDNCKKYRVIIEGINAAGQLTREEQTFE